MVFTGIARAKHVAWQATASALACSNGHLCQRRGVQPQRDQHLVAAATAATRVGSPAAPHHSTAVKRKRKRAQKAQQRKAAHSKRKLQRPQQSDAHKAADGAAATPTPVAKRARAATVPTTKQDNQCQNSVRNAPASGDAEGVEPASPHAQLARWSDAVLHCVTEDGSVRNDAAHVLRAAMLHRDAGAVAAVRDATLRRRRSAAADATAASPGALSQAGAQRGGPSSAAAERDSADIGSVVVAAMQAMPVPHAVCVGTALAACEPRGAAGTTPARPARSIQQSAAAAVQRLAHAAVKHAADAPGEKGFSYLLEFAEQVCRPELRGAIVWRACLHFCPSARSAQCLQLCSRASRRVFAQTVHRELERACVSR